MSIDTYHKEIDRYRERENEWIKDCYYTPKPHIGLLSHHSHHRSTMKLGFCMYGAGYETLVIGFSIVVSGHYFD